MSAGWGFPFKISTDNGRVEISEMRENIRQSVKIILMTEPGERMACPEFGTKLHQFIFENMDSQTEEMICREVRQSLRRWEKRIQVTRVETDIKHGKQGELRVAVAYRIVDGEESDRVEIML